jgi:hypothetical protein
LDDESQNGSIVESKNDVAAVENKNDGAVAQTGEDADTEPKKNNTSGSPADVEPKKKKRKALATSW